MTTQEASDQRHYHTLTPRQLLLTLMVLAIGALIVHVLLTQALGVSGTTSSRWLTFFYVVALITLAPHAAAAVLPRAARAWLRRNVQVRESWDSFHALQLRADRRDQARRDFSGSVRPIRRDKVSLPGALALLAVLLAAFILPAGFLLLFAAALILPFLSFRHWRRLRDNQIELAGLELIERDPTGGVVARIDTRQPFTWEYVDKATGSAIYQLRQGNEALVFDSESPLALTLVKDLLRAEWPPMDRFGF